MRNDNEMPPARILREISCGAETRLPLTLAPNIFHYNFVVLNTVHNVA